MPRGHSAACTASSIALSVGTAGARGQFPRNDGRLGAVWASVARLRPCAAAHEGLKPWDQGPGRGSHVDPLQPAPQHPPAAAQLGAAGVCCPLHTGPGRWGVGPGHRSPVHLRVRAPLPHFLESRFPRAFQRQSHGSKRSFSGRDLRQLYQCLHWLRCGSRAQGRYLGILGLGDIPPASVATAWGQKVPGPLCTLPRLFLAVLDCGACGSRK